MCVNDLFHFCTVAVHTIPNSFSCQHKKLSGYIVIDNSVSCMTPIIYLFPGHSRLVIGVEEHSGKDGGLYLLLFDPSHSAKQMQSLLEDIQSSSSGLRHLRRSLKQMRCKQYQIVYVDGIMEPSEMEESKTMDSLRVP